MITMVGMRTPIDINAPVYVTMHTKDGIFELNYDEFAWKRPAHLTPHRTDGPAMIYVDGAKDWYQNGELHREDGPACERPDWSYGNGRNRWWIDGELLKIIPQHVLTNYMKAYNLTVAHLLTDSDPLVRESANKYEWWY